MNSIFLLCCYLHLLLDAGRNRAEVSFLDVPTDLLRKDVSSAGVPGAAGLGECLCSKSLFDFTSAHRY